MSAVLTPEQDASTVGENGIGQYMQDIRHFPRLSADEERALAMDCAHGDEEAIKKMVSSNLRLVVSVAKEYAGRGVPLLDLIQEGSIGLIAAARKFDYTRDVRFSTYATKWIRQGVARCFADHSGLIRVPHYTAEKVHKVLQAKSELAQRYGYEPDLQPISAYCNMDQEKVKGLLSVIPQVYSIDAPVGEDGEEGLAALLEDLHAPQPQEELVRRELRNTMENMLSMLTSRQQQVLRLRYGMTGDEPCSLEQIAKRLSVSKERVRQVEHEAIAKLKKIGADFGLEDYLD